MNDDSNEYIGSIRSEDDNQESEDKFDEYDHIYA